MAATIENTDTCRLENARILLQIIETHSMQILTDDSRCCPGEKGDAERLPSAAGERAQTRAAPLPRVAILGNSIALLWGTTPLWLSLELFLF
jgi:hypothetical protein